MNAATQSIKTGDFVICIDNSKASSQTKVPLTIGKTYRVESVFSEMLGVRNDLGNFDELYRWRFLKFENGHNR